MDQNVWSAWRVLNVSTNYHKKQKIMDKTFDESEIRTWQIQRIPLGVKQHLSVTLPFMTLLDSLHYFSCCWHPILAIDVFLDYPQTLYPQLDKLNMPESRKRLDFAYKTAQEAITWLIFDEKQETRVKTIWRTGYMQCGILQGAITFEKCH